MMIQGIKRKQLSEGTAQVIKINYLINTACGINDYTFNFDLEDYPVDRKCRQLKVVYEKGSIYTIYLL